MRSDQSDIHDAVHKLEKFRSHYAHSNLIEKGPIIPRDQSETSVERSTGPGPITRAH